MEFIRKLTSSFLRDFFQGYLNENYFPKPTLEINFIM